MPSFTPTEQRILDVLKDGGPHDRAELQACLNDTDALPGTLRAHMGRIRAKLATIGQDVVCHFTANRHMVYRQVRHLHSPNDGRT